jgi:hypothetical protein
LGKISNFQTAFKGSRKATISGPGTRTTASAEHHQIQRIANYFSQKNKIFFDCANNFSILEFCQTQKKLNPFFVFALLSGGNFGPSRWKWMKNDRTIIFCCSDGK